ncbi:aminoglycoside phosphotransferase family protein [Nocardiopsis ganjiahuensis]|uniref:aminoglycoside phosphotransferase family protein n=1 Tax=Nocardiopsis ganjiahuensis TaxID=239984 RepID=UPI00034ABF41|nr:aminoglycoside phosphotransferase family protein [Nocardiopsis ganjiahuensis]
MNDVTAQFVDSRQRRRLERRFGAHVTDWLAELPAVVEKLAAEWRLTVEGPAPHGRTSVVLYVRRADSEGVLKLSPDSGLAVSEAGLLRMWESSPHVPDVWGVNAEHGAVLMERVEGDTVAETGVVPPMETIGGLIARLHAVEVSPAERMELRPLSARVQFVFDVWGRERVEGAAADLVPAAVMHRGAAKARDLAHGEDDVVPLHGDLHPGNVIDGGARGLVVLDPRACLGDGAADAVDWAVWKAADIAEVEHRVGVLSDVMAVDGERMMEWVRAFAPCFAVAKANRGQADSVEFDLMMGLCGAAA